MPGLDFPFLHDLIALLEDLDRFMGVLYDDTQGANIQNYAAEYRQTARDFRNRYSDLMDHINNVANGDIEPGGTPTRNRRAGHPPTADEWNEGLEVDAGCNHVDCNEGEIHVVPPGGRFIYEGITIVGRQMEDGRILHRPSSNYYWGGTGWVRHPPEPVPESAEPECTDNSGHDTDDELDNESDDSGDSEL